MAKFKKGNAVRQAFAAPICGTVVGYAACQNTGDVHVIVEYQDTDGVTHQRTFVEDQLELNDLTKPAAI